MVCHDPFLVLVLGHLQELADRPVSLSGLGVRHLVTELGDELTQRLSLAGRAHRGCGRQRRAAVGLAPGNPLGHPHIGQQHEVLDQAVGVQHALDEHLHGLSIVVEAELDLLGVEIDAPRFEPPGPHLLGQPVEPLDPLARSSRSPPLLRLGIGETTIGMDHGAAEPFLHHCPSLSSSTALNAYRSSLGRREQRLLDSTSGSMGMVRSTR